MKLWAKKHWPLFGAFCIYWITLTVLIIISIKNNQGHLIYPLDDTYIHMAIAKNAALYHVWGVTKYAFTSSTSSPLWTALLAATYFVFGVNEASPLLLNLLFGTLTIAAANMVLTRYINSPIKKFGILLVAIFVTPLPTLTIAGMEHVLHMLLSLCFVYFSILTLSENIKPLQRNHLFLILLAPLISTVRYEGIFLIFVVCILFLFQKRIFFSAAIGVIALLPVTIYGIWSMAHGWFFLPNPILLKGQIPGFSPAGISNLLRLALNKILGTSHILLLLIISLFLLVFIYRREEKSFNDKKYANLIFIGTLLLHMVFASVGWFYRYEAYLVFLGVIVVSLSANDLLTEKYTKTKTERAIYCPMAILFILIATFQCSYRTYISLRDTPQATTNIYQQQYQMGLFIKQFYQGKTIVLNDIGAVAYLADVRLVDLSGLGSLEPAKLKMQSDFTTRQKNKITRQEGAIIAIAFEQPGELPRKWTKVGQWQILNNIVCASNTVSFYAIDPLENADLIKNLRQFATELPIDVNQYGTYTEK